ncbi:alpha-1,4-glucan--maltose-1-phosphate maltosyltransferase [Candidatus Magnetominusculus dajiuhuensis]|uniref:alpha-1,4-glucan--maltose-1-phosphate maltosyltransferase n=1 Tax=Candidatus Magnetominusculus dajiuhuensis TaxID=3137712 RepID=UPI003B4357DB
MLNKPFVIKDIVPCVDGGRYPIKREVGDVLTIRATVFRDGHDITRAVLKYKEKYSGDTSWECVDMVSVNHGLDLWEGSFALEKNTRYLYTIEAYTDVFSSWLKDTMKKFEAGQDVKSELAEGVILIDSVIGHITSEEEKRYFADVVEMVKKKKMAGDKLRIMSDPLLMDIIKRYAVRADLTVYEPYLEAIADRERARYAAWYEFFPRSAGKDPSRSATFKECQDRLPAIKEMGFDVVYLPPIHPIGKTKRKGPNNSLTAGPDDPGSPYAIGNAGGGHMAVEPGLGTIEDFGEFEKACRALDMEIALDFAINCSPDHPYVKEHPEWFFKRPDGSIKYAENPPKKYEDIYPLNFYAPDGAWKALWEEMRLILTFWIEKGVRIFRVDNPHTKPIPFWDWLISELQRQYPDVIFLAEAFTRPPVMRALAAVGFTQSYTYFTWRNFKGEIIDYFTELTQSEAKEYMRGNLFANTPDILPQILQIGGRAAFKMRFVLAATLSSVYGIYSGYELCEANAIEGKEEYLNSEKYEFKVWDWDRPNNITDFIILINRIRRENPALHHYKNLRFFRADNENILFYGKASSDGKNIILVVANLDPFQTHNSMVYIPLQSLGIGHDETYELQNLINGERLLCKGEEFFVTLNPDWEPAFVFRLDRWTHKEEKFDYFAM